MRNFVALALCAAAFCLLSCSGTPTSSSSKPAARPSDSRATDASKAAREGNFAPLVGRVWRVSAAPYGPASGSIYIFLPNGTLLETSCVETYRIATWSVDPAEPSSLRVIEDRRPAFSATLGEASGNTLHLHQKLLHSSETRELTLTAVDGEFVCPDLRK
jgi:hypothetical protein